MNPKAELAVARENGLFTTYSSIINAKPSEVQSKSVHGMALVVLYVVIFGDMFEGEKLENGDML